MVVVFTCLSLFADGLGLSLSIYRTLVYYFGLEQFSVYSQSPLSDRICTRVSHSGLGSPPHTCSVC